MLRKIVNVYCFVKYVMRTKNWHFSNRINSPLSIDGIKNIEMGRNAFIKANAYIIVLPLTGEESSRFQIGENSHFQFGAHIVSTKSVIIGNNCNIGSNVYIADNTHNYEDINIAPKFQKIKQLKEVVIGDDTWVGRNSSIIGCKIGKHCVIGANSLVNKDIPDYSVAGGNPARILKRYNFDLQQWQKTDKDGNFI